MAWMLGFPENALMDESGVFPYRYHSTMIIHTHNRLEDEE
jgi:hypothetical protein